MYKIAITREEKLAAVLYWEEMRKIAKKIREDYDRPNENSFHKNFMSRISKDKYRPEFMEPLYNIKKK